VAESCGTAQVIFGWVEGDACGSGGGGAGVGSGDAEDEGVGVGEGKGLGAGLARRPNESAMPPMASTLASAIHFVLPRFIPSFCPFYRNCLEDPIHNPMRGPAGRGGVDEAHEILDGLFKSPSELTQSGPKAREWRDYAPLQNRIQGFWQVFFMTNQARRVI
jgi:hypothetical protein